MVPRGARNHPAIRSERSESSILGHDLWMSDNESKDGCCFRIANGLTEDLIGDLSGIAGPGLSLSGARTAITLP